MRLWSWSKVSLSILSFVLVVTSWSAAGVAPVDQVMLASGAVKGEVVGDVVSFKGMPFAAPPIGSLRWRAPQAPAAWQGVRSANKFGPDCMQAPAGPIPAGTEMSEDCLYLNVWAPAARSAKPLPVMVWIYGGGFVNGGTARYSATDNGVPSAKRGVVFVNFNYRLGRFGFFAHPALTAEKHDGPLGNYGYMDQLAALKWVQKNIAAFGGDPNNVTIFGESAGGGSVLTLLTSPAARGLFHRVIVQSGGGRNLLMGPRQISTSVGPAVSAEELGLSFASSVGITGTGADALASLRALAPEKVVAGLNMGTMFASANTYSGPMIDGQIVQESPESALLSGHWAKLPVMIGANSADIGFPTGRTIEDLLKPFGPNAEKAKAAFDPEDTADVRAVGMRIASDRMMVEPARFVARAVTAAGIPAYEFRFSYVAESLRPTVTGAAHASEVPYVLGTVKMVYGDKLTKKDEAVQDQANAYWTNFVKTGNPNGPGLPNWPVYDQTSDVILDFMMDGPKAVPDPWKSRLDLIEGIAKQP